MFTLFFLQEGCGKNIICKIEEAVDSVGSALLSLIDTVLDNFIPIAIFLIAAALLYAAVKKWREGESSWQDIAGWIWDNYITVGLVIIVGVGAVIALNAIFPDLFTRIGDVYKGFLGLGN